MAEGTMSVAHQAVKLAQKKALVKDAAKILLGLKKKACGSKAKKARRGVTATKMAATTLAVKLLKRARAASPKGKLAKAAAKAIIFLKRGTLMQKRAAILDLLKQVAIKAKGGLRAAGAHTMRGTGAAMKGVGSAAKKVGLGGVGKSLSRAGSKVRTQGGRALRSASGKGFRNAERVGAGLGGAAAGTAIGALSGGEDKPEKKPTL